MVQIPKFWCLNLCTNICPSFGNIHSIKMVINNELAGEETLKTINFKPNFCIENHKKWNNSFFPPWTDLKSHIPWMKATDHTVLLVYGMPMGMKIFTFRLPGWCVWFIEHNNLTKYNLFFEYFSKNRRGEWTISSVLVSSCDSSETKCRGRMRAQFNI